jgi:hypothetical protein
MNENESAPSAETAAPETESAQEGLSLAEIRQQMMDALPDDEPESGSITTPEKPAEEPKAEEPRAAKAIANAIKREAEAKRAIKEAGEKSQRAQDILDKALRVKSGEVDPDELLAALGIDYRFITEAKFKNAKPEPDKAEQALSEIEQLKASLAKREQELEYRRVQQEESYAMQQLGAKAREVIAAGGDRYDAIKAYGYEDKVVELQIAHYKATAEAGQPEVLTMEQAADTLEQTLAAELQKAASTKYFRSANPQLATSVKVASRPSTLSNTLTGTARAEPPENTSMSLAEARKRILDMLE